MRILHIVQRYSPAIGGSEKFFQEMSERLVRAGHSVQVLTTDALEIEAFWLRGRQRVATRLEEINGVPVERLPVLALPQQGRLWKLLVRLPGEGAKLRFHFPSPLVPSLRRRLRQLDGAFDLVHAAALPYSSLLYAAEGYARRNRIPLVLTPFLHLGVDEGEGTKWYTRPDQLHLLARANRVLVQTATEREFLARRGVREDRLTVLGMGVNPEELLNRPPGEPAGADFSANIPRDFFVYQMGALTRDKGTLFLIESLRTLWQRGLEIPLILAGHSGQDFVNYYQRLPEESRQRIQLLGRISDAERYELLRRDGLLVHPSRSESFGIVFLEAWLWGKAVVGARAGALADVIDDGKDGVLVDFDDRDGLAATIQRLWGDADLRRRLGAAGREKVLARFTWDKVFARLGSVYTQLAPDGPPQGRTV